MGAAPRPLIERIVGWKPMTRPEQTHKIGGADILCVSEKEQWMGMGMVPSEPVISAGLRLEPWGTARGWTSPPSQGATVNHWLSECALEKIRPLQGF